MYALARTGRRIVTKAQFEEVYAELAQKMRQARPFDRGEVHAQKTTRPDMVTKELLHVQLVLGVDLNRSAWQEVMSPNLPWAEDHFQERVSGEPLNPPPAEAWWPFAQNGNSDHKKGEKFSHTYPERFWPRFANVEGTTNTGRQIFVPHVGIRFEYGDLEDLIKVLMKNPRSRQAYLPVWFPEDLAAAVAGERVPCTLGYHFLMNSSGRMDMTYSMRSCDMVRFLRDDIYMAGRLLQWVCDRVRVVPGDLVLNIANLHTFEGDDSFLAQVITDQRPNVSASVRDGYDWGALY